MLATPEQVRAAVPGLSCVESRRLNTSGPFAVFERRDGKTVRVHPDDVLPALSTRVGCVFVIERGTEVRGTELIALTRCRGGTRWQAPLSTLTETEAPSLLGAIPQPGGLTLISGEGPALVFSQLSWDDGAVRRIIRWD